MAALASATAITSSTIGLQTEAFSKFTTALEAYLKKDPECSITREDLLCCITKIFGKITSSKDSFFVRKKNREKIDSPRTVFVEAKDDLAKVWVVSSKELWMSSSKRIKAAVSVQFSKRTLDFRISASVVYIFSSSKAPNHFISFKDIPNVLETQGYIKRRISPSAGSGTIEPPETEKFYTFHPKAHLGDMSHFISPGHRMSTTIAKLKSAIIGLSCAARFLASLHEKDCIFCDMKPDNILGIGEDKWSIGDLESIVKIENISSTCSFHRFSTLFIPPELHTFLEEKPKGPLPFPPKPVDVWTFGMTILMVLSEDAFYRGIFNIDVPYFVRTLQGYSPPVRDKMIRDMAFAVLAAITDEKIDSVIRMIRASSSLKDQLGDEGLAKMQDLLAKLLRKEPAARISMQQAFDELAPLAEKYRTELVEAKSPVSPATST